MMEKAIEVMLQSVPESRKDGKASPKVGAVLVAPAEFSSSTGPLITACRGELRDGDHAEFTLLERKCRDKKLDGAVMFTTLEPCGPGARNHPKLPCAERIVLARIREVYVGIEDPDPTVDRKGIKYLQENGVTVHMFERDLQERIHEANKEFIAQAIERAAAAEEKKEPRPIILSPLENASVAVIGDLSIDALEQYRQAAKIGEKTGTPEFYRRLALLGLLKAGHWTPTGFGLLLFGKEPRLAMPNAGLLGTIHFADGREEPKDFFGPQVFVPEQALQWLRDKLPDPVDRSEARRQPVNQALFELLREGIVNALVHRDYGIEGAKCQLIATNETIVVKSPGQPPSPITMEQLQSLTAPMLSRNPVLHYVFSQMGLAEERGLGLKSMKDRATRAGLPLPSYKWEDPYLVLTLYRSAESVSRTLKSGIAERLSDDEKRGWEFLNSQKASSQKLYSLALNLNPRAAQRHLQKFVELGLVKRGGSGRATVYEVIPQ